MGVNLTAHVKKWQLSQLHDAQDGWKHHLLHVEAAKKSEEVWGTEARPEEGLLTEVRRVGHKRLKPVEEHTEMDQTGSQK